MKKKICKMLLAVLVAGILVTGCGDSSTGSSSRSSSRQSSSSSSRQSSSSSSGSSSRQSSSSSSGEREEAAAPQVNMEEVRADADRAYNQLFEDAGKGRLLTASGTINGDCSSVIDWLAEDYLNYINENYPDLPYNPFSAWTSITTDSQKTLWNQIVDTYDYRVSTAVNGDQVDVTVRISNWDYCSALADLTIQYYKEVPKPSEKSGADYAAEFIGTWLGEKALEVTTGEEAHPYADFFGGAISDVAAEENYANGLQNGEVAETLISVLPDYIKQYENCESVITFQAQQNESGEWVIPDVVREISGDSENSYNSKVIFLMICGG